MNERHEQAPERMPSELQFMVCERGFLIRENSNYGLIGGRIWAFDQIGDLAIWLADKYGKGNAA